MPRAWRVYAATSVPVIAAMVAGPDSAVAVRSHVVSREVVLDASEPCCSSAVEKYHRNRLDASVLPVERETLPDEQ